MKSTLTASLLLALCNLSAACSSNDRSAEPSSDLEPTDRQIAGVGGPDRSLQQESMPRPATTTSVAKASAQASVESPESAPRRPDVVYVPTPQPVVDKMLELAKVKKGDVVFDLGCGDGRIVVSAAKKGARAHGFDIDPERVKEAKANVKRAGVEDLATIEQADIFTLDLSSADVVTLYLLPELNVRLIPQLQKLKSGARVVSHDFDMAGVAPLKHLTMRPPAEDREHEVFLWHAPIRPAGAISAR